MRSRIALIALVCVGATGLAVAQTSPSQDTTSPSTSNQPKEAPTSSSTSNPSAASSPHQRQAMGKEPNQMMKDCIAKQRAQDSSMSKSDAKKACKEEMKEEKSSSPKNR